MLGLGLLYALAVCIVCFTLAAVTGAGVWLIVALFGGTACIVSQS